MVGHVTIVGLGAVGSIAAERLALEGVARLRLVDRDIVE
ncbi:MAG: ThiF family adenylyltransferase, partial [Thermoplasmata archaeon]